MAKEHKVGKWGTNCDYCQEPFRAAQRLKEHVQRKHEKVPIKKTFSCQKCQQSFNTEFKLSSFLCGFSNPKVSTHRVDSYTRTGSSSFLRGSVRPQTLKFTNHCYSCVHIWSNIIFQYFYQYL